MTRHRHTGSGRLPSGRSPGAFDAGRQRPGESGWSLVEVLVAALVAGLAIVGVALMFGSGSAWISVLGEDRVALGLAEQEIELIRDAGWAGAVSRLGASAEPCVRLGGRPSPGPGGLCPAAERTFARMTCVQYVNADGARPEALAEPVYSVDCPAGNPAAVQTVRITVTVRQNRQPQATPVTLQAWLTESGR